MKKLLLVPLLATSAWFTGCANSHDQASTAQLSPNAQRHASPDRRPSAPEPSGISPAGPNYPAPQ